MGVKQRDYTPRKMSFYEKTIKLSGSFLFSCGQYNMPILEIQKLNLAIYRKYDQVLFFQYTNDEAFFTQLSLFIK